MEFMIWNKFKQMLIEFEAEYVSKFDTSYVETQELYALVDNQMNSTI